MKKALLIIILPALIAGFFSFAPKLYDIISKPKAKLVYTPVLGLPVAFEGKFLRTYSVQTENAGKKPLSNLVASLTISHGTIKSREITATHGLIVKELKREGGFAIQTDQFLPRDFVNINVVIIGESKDITPTFSVRTQEVSAILPPKELKKKEEWKYVLGSFLTVISVFIMTLIFYLRIRLGRGLSILSFHCKPDALRYIFARARVPRQFCEEVWRGENTTYMKAGDILMAYGLSENNSNREKAIKAMKGLLFVKPIAKHSREAVICNLRILEGDSFSQDNVDSIISRSIDIDNIVEFRNRIDELFLT